MLIGEGEDMPKKGTNIKEWYKTDLRDSEGRLPEGVLCNGCSERWKMNVYGPCCKVSDPEGPHWWLGERSPGNPFH